jgi:hypothetical protein
MKMGAAQGPWVGYAESRHYLAAITIACIHVTRDKTQLTIPSARGHRLCFSHNDRNI